MLHRVRQQLRQGDRRNLQDARGVGGHVVGHHPRRAAVAHAGDEELPAQGRQLLLQGHQRSRARGKQVSIGVAERLDERKRVGAPVLDQVRQRVKAVEQEVRIDLTRQRGELGA